MGVETALVGGGLGALGGAIKGGKGTPDQVQTTQSNIGAAGTEEQQLQAASLDNYNKAQGLAGQFEQQVGGAQSYQDMARQAGQGILSGQAFNVTPEEQQRIQGLRDSLIQQGTADVGYQTEQGLAKAVGSAAGRGLRGQALGALQGQVLESQQRNVRDIANQANTMASQAYLQAPGQRIAAQSGLIGQGMSLADQLRQQALVNRQNLQDPALMQYLQRERIAGASQTTRSPGQKGGFAGALGGALGGFGQGYGIGGGVAKAASSMSVPSWLRGQSLSDIVDAKGY